MILKSGYSFIFAAIAYLVIERWLNLLEPYVPDLEIPLNFVDVIFIILAVVGIFIIFRDSVKKTDETTQSKIYDAKKLNDEVFRKLMRVSYSTNPMYFTHELGFIIPTNKEEFLNKESSEYFEYLLRHSGDSVVHNHAKIESEIPTLKIGEDYLKENYLDVFKEWQEIKRTIEEYNKKYHECTADFAKQAEKKIVSEFPTFHHHEKFNDGNLADHYFFENIGNTVIESINSGNNTNNLKLSIGEFYLDKNYWILAVSKPNYNLMGSYDKNKFDIDKLEKILCNIVKDPHNIVKYWKSRELDFMKLGKQIDKFCDNLEKNVVNDIDNQITS